MKKSELKEIIRECITELSEAWGADGAMVDTLTNSMEHFSSADDFAKELSRSTSHDKASLKKIFDSYWKIGAKDRLHYGDNDWKKWLKKQGK
jgi:hypothetical protein